MAVWDDGLDHAGQLVLNAAVLRLGAGNDKLRIERELPDPKARAQMVRDILRSLGQPKIEKVEG